MGNNRTVLWYNPFIRLFRGYIWRTGKMTQINFKYVRIQGKEPAPNTMCAKGIFSMQRIDERYESDQTGN